MTQTEERPNFVFIVGSIRSGTTMMMHLLNRHSCIAIAPETKALLVQFPWTTGAPACGYAGVFETAEAYVGMLRKQIREWKEVNENDMRDAVAGVWDERSTRKIFEALVDCWCGNSMIRGEKTPSHLYVYNKLREYYPDAVFVQLMRDPRAVIASDLVKELKHDRLEGRRHRFLRLLSRVKEWNYAAKCASVRMESDSRYIVVKYESVVATPEQQMRELLGRLNLSFEPDILAIPKVNSSFSSGYEDKNKSFDPKDLTLWKKHLSVFERTVICSLCKDKSKWGYKGV